MRLLCSLFLLLSVVGGGVGFPRYAVANDITNGDPLESFNRKVFAFNRAFDNNVLKPVVEGYVAITPSVLRKGVTNFFDNLGYPNVILNDFLQGKILQGLSDIIRFSINTTIGVGGVFDPATHMGLLAHKEDIGQTLGVWGSGEIAYLELPFVGSNSARDAADVYLSQVVSLVSFVNSNALLFPLLALNTINTRANLSQIIAVRDRSAVDPYIFTRDVYRQRREFLIHDGDPPELEFEAENNAKKEGKNLKISMARSHLSLAKLF